MANQFYGISKRKVVDVLTSGMTISRAKVYSWKVSS